MPAAPWEAGDLNAALAEYAIVAEALAEPSVELRQVGLKPVGDGDDFDEWRTHAAGVPGVRPSLPGWVPFSKLEVLAELESKWRSAVAGTAAPHHDLRQDNVLLDAHDARGSATGTGSL